MSVVLRGVSGNLADVDGTGALKIQGTFSATNTSITNIGSGSAPVGGAQIGGMSAASTFQAPGVYNTTPSGTEYGLLVRTVGNVPVTGTFWQATQPVSIASSVAVTGTFWQATQPVSIASMPSTPVTGTFWQATQPISAVQLPAALGQTTMANALSVVLASNQSSIPVTLASTTITGSVAVTGTFFQATQPISAVALPLPSGAATEATLGNVLTTAAFQARQPVLGQGTMAASMPVVIASNQSSIPVTLASTTITGSVAVTGTFWQATQPVSIAATVAVSSTQLPAALGAQASASSLSVVPATGSSFAVTGTFWQATQPISATSLPLPTGASTDSTLSTMSAKLPAALGQTTMAASMSVAIASNQSAIPVTLTSTTITGSVAVTGTFWQSTQPVSIAATVTTQGAKTNNNAAPGATNLGALVAIANAAAPTYTEGNQVLLSTDLTGALRITGSISATNPSVGTSGSAIPTSSTLVGGSDGTLLRALKVDATGQLYIANPGGAASVLMADATANPTIPQQAGFLMGFNGTTWDRVKTANTGRLQVDVVTGGGSNASVGATGAAAPASATYAGVLSGGNLVGMVQPLTDTLLRASPVPVSLTSTTITGSVAVTGTFWQATQPVSSTQLPAALGQTTMAASMSVAIASNQSAIPVTLTSTTITGSVAVTGTFWQTTQPISAAALPLPTGASTETTLGTRLADATFTGRIPVNGQALMAASVPVVIASNQSAIPVTLTSTTITGSVAVTGTFWQATQPVSIAATVAVSATQLPASLGQKAMAASLAVALASDQSAIPVTLTSTTITGTVAATQSGTWNIGTLTSITNTVVVQGAKTNNNAAPGATNVGALVAIANAAAPTYTEGNQVLLSTDLSGNLRITGSISASNPSVSTTGTAVPASATMVGGTDGTNLRAFKVDSTGQLFIANPGGAASVLMADATANPTIPQSASFLVGFNGTTWDRVRTANTGRLQVDVITGGSAGSSTPADAFANPTTAGLAQDFLMGFNGTTWDRLRSSIANGLAVDVTRVQGNVTSIGATTPSDAFANPTTALSAAAFNMVWNTGLTQWVRVQDGASNADGDASFAIGAMVTENYPKIFNGTSWDRPRSVTANGTTLQTGGLGTQQMAGFMYGWSTDQTGWLPIKREGTDSDGEAVIVGASNTAGILSTESYPKIFNGTTWDRVRGNTTYGTQTYVADQTATGTLGALNAAVTVACQGSQSVGFTIGAGLTSATIVAEASVDGGVTWIPAYIDNITKLASIVNPTANSYTIVGIGGASNYRIRVSAYTSGSATCSMRANMMGDPAVMFGTSPGGINPPSVAVMGGAVTTAFAAYSNATSNFLSMDLGGNLRTLTVGYTTGAGTTSSVATVKAASTVSAATDTSLVVAHNIGFPSLIGYTVGAGTTASIATVKAASVVPAATDTSLVTSLNPNAISLFGGAAGGAGTTTAATMKAASTHPAFTDTALVVADRADGALAAAIPSTAQLVGVQATAATQAYTAGNQQTPTMELSGNLRVVTRPTDVGALGSYRISTVSGTVAAGLGAGSAVWAFRTGATNPCIIRKVVVSVWNAGTGFTSAGLGKLALFVARSFSASYSAGGTAATITTNNGKKKTAFGTTTIAQIYMTTTAAISGATNTLDAQPFAQQNFAVPTTASVVILPTTDLFNAGAPAPQNWPIVLAANEGLVIQATMGAGGTWSFQVDVEWDEVVTAP
jgi:hypothetical protein